MNTALEIGIYLFAALLPAVILMVYIYRNDRIEKESLPRLLKCVLLGVVAAFFAMVLEQLFTTCVLDTLNIKSKILDAVLDSLMVGFVEEGCKYYFLKRNIFESYEFDYVYDGIVYAVFIGLGFAAIENVLYVFKYGLSIALARGLLSVPAHMSFAVYMGSSFSFAKQDAVYGHFGRSKWHLFCCYVIPALLHATYDTCVSIESDFFFWIFIVFVAVVYGIAFMKIKIASKNDCAIYREQA